MSSRRSQRETLDEEVQQEEGDSEGEGARAGGGRHGEIVTLPVVVVVAA